MVLRNPDGSAVGSGGPEALLVHRPRLDDWSVPKGKLEEGEHLLSAAVREVAEESGVTPALGRRLESVHYRVGGSVHKVVHYWTATVADEQPRDPDEEVDEIRWVPLARAAALATHRWDRRMLTALSRAGEPGLGVVGVPPVVLVRHAKARPRKGWTGEDRARPLAPEGERQALSLVPLLETFAPGAVLTSSSTRCLQTVLPFTRATGRALQAVPALTEETFETNPATAHDLVDSLLADRRPGAAPTLVCTHRPLLDALLHRLTGDAPDPKRLAPAEVAVLTGVGAGLVIDRYPAPG